MAQLSPRVYVAPPPERLTAALADRYRLERELGVGGMATVYLALDLKHNRKVAIKVLRPALAAALGAERFFREIETTANLRHPHILPLYDSGQAAGFLYFVMPLVEGESLRERLNREKQLPVDDALQIAREVADALAYSHAHGVVHRDVKPENILLQDGHALVADFGIARTIATPAEAGLTEAGIAIGTPAYMSPEQALGSDIDGRSDLYSLGCVLFEMLTGSPPYLDTTPQVMIARKLTEPPPRVAPLRHGVSVDVDRAVRRVLARTPEGRFSTASEFAAALGGGRTPAVARRGRRFLSGVALVAAIGTVAVVAWLLIRSPEGPRFDSTPHWSAVRGWTGEYFAVIATTDSLLIVESSDMRAVQVFDGQRWARLPLPDSLELVPYSGQLPGRALLASRPLSVPSGQPEVIYQWLVLAPDGVHPMGPVTPPLPDAGGASWWSTGSDLALWSAGQEYRLEAGGWLGEPLGPARGISSAWGLDQRHRFAIPTMPHDSLLVYDGAGWVLTNITGGPGRLEPTLAAGVTLGDSTTVVVGELCDGHGRCSSLVVQQDGFGAPWHSPSIPPGTGMPSWQTGTSHARCAPDHFAFSGVAGRSRSDYTVWGTWITCDAAPLQRQAGGCPPLQPCTWQMIRGRLAPVYGLLGRTVQAMATSAVGAYAVLDDGTVWRRADTTWQAVTQVPDLPARMVTASPRVLLRATGTALWYEPGRSDTSSGFFTSPWAGQPAGAASTSLPRQLVIHDSSLALLTRDGKVYRSGCRMDRSVSNTSGMALTCQNWAPLPAAPRRVLAIALLADGRLLGVGTDGLAVTWTGNGMQTESLPVEVRGDSLWGIAVTAAGEALAISDDAMVRRDDRGAWALVRRFEPGQVVGPLAAFLPDGDVVVQGKTASQTLRVWDRTTGAPPVAQLYSAAAGEDQVSALQVLPDGRLVAGFANPEGPLHPGRLRIWRPPFRPGAITNVELPLRIDVTGLAEDGRYLYVVGRGGSLAIPLDSLPLAAGLMSE